METFGKQDPYCAFTLGKEKKRTKTIKKGGTAPDFRREEVVFGLNGSNFSAVHTKSMG